MPVREFVDSSGVEWRAWEVTPDAIYPPTRGEDYLADCYQLGWVILETKSGDRRVRLCPIPRDWNESGDGPPSVSRRLWCRRVGCRREDARNTHWPSTWILSRTPRFHRRAHPPFRARPA